MHDIFNESLWNLRERPHPCPLREHRLLAQIGEVDETTVWIALAAAAGVGYLAARLHASTMWALLVGGVVLSVSVLFAFFAETSAMEYLHACEEMTSIDEDRGIPDNERFTYQECIESGERSGLQGAAGVAFAAAGYLLGRIVHRKQKPEQSPTDVPV